jgi:hypothetical protein
MEEPGKQTAMWLSIPSSGKRHSGPWGDGALTVEKAAASQVISEAWLFHWHTRLCVLHAVKRAVQRQKRKPKNKSLFFPASPCRKFLQDLQF